MSYCFIIICFFASNYSFEVKSSVYKSKTINTMRKSLLTLMCLATMMMVGAGLKAQDITITLNPGWTWISYLKAEALDIATALGDFVPVEGDIIKSQYSFSEYHNGNWSGGLQQFTPGLGYMYFSMRVEPATLVFGISTPQPQVFVTTSEPMLITAISAMGGGEVTVSDGTYIITKGLCWATHENPTTNDDFYEEAESGVGSFSLSMTGLNISTTYYVRAYAVTGNGTVYGDQKTFTTRDGIPTLTTDSVMDITGITATCGGNITDNGGLNVTARGVCWSTSPNPTIADSHTTNGSGTGSFSSNITRLNLSTTYYVRAYATTAAGTAYGDEKTFITRDDHDYVDLGLPSGLLWATCNIGADAPEDYGNYFAWGETQPKATYNWSTYQHCNGSYNTLTKYSVEFFDWEYGCDQSYGYNGFIDNLTTLEPSDDAATANWGNDWRMPTMVEWQELYNNTTCTWTTWNDVNGRLFTASNGNSLFLPAAGFCYDSSLSYAGSYGDYWSSSLDTYSPDYAWYFDFNSGYYSMYSHVGYGYSRCIGSTVRPVRFSLPNPSFVIDATANPAEGGMVSGGGTYQEGAECTLITTANEGYTFANWTENGSVVSTNATYTFTVSVNRTLVANFSYNGGGDTHAYVDLGLPSGLLWAACNVGAEAPEGYGDYFAWGETQPKSTYNWGTYQYCMGSYNTLTKYCNNSSYGYNGFTDNLTTLLPEDDAATANWGAEWRSPTREEWIELRDNTSCTWSIQNGVNGVLFTAANGNSLFLPAAGYRRGSSIDDAGSYGYYGSSSLATGMPTHYATNFYFYYSDHYYILSDLRDYGFTVRPVCSSSSLSFVIDATVNPVEGGMVSGSGSYQLGAECMLTATANEGYTFTSWKENGNVVSTNANYTFTVSGNRILVANFSYGGGGNAPTGAINGKFTINEDGDQVYFSQGNLQYQASTDTWRFADNQYDYVGSTNSNISSTYSGWIDLFGWGTSGYNHGANCYQPWSTSQTNSNYYAYGSYTYNLYDQTGQADWGYNPISNGGNQSNQWRTLTQPEWAYVFNTRTTTSGIRYAKANVNNVNGVILLPDDWNTSTYSLNSTNTYNASFSSNTLTASQWSTLEQAGAVFLPAAGCRDGASVYDVGSDCNYWSASYGNSYYAYYVFFYVSSLSTGSNGSRDVGFSIRLVRVAEN